MVLPDSGGLVLALVAHARFLVGLLVVEKEPGGPACAGAAGWAAPAPSRGRPSGGTDGGGVVGRAAGAAQGPAGEAAGDAAWGVALGPPALGQCFSVRGQLPAGSCHALSRSVRPQAVQSYCQDFKDSGNIFLCCTSVSMQFLPSVTQSELVLTLLACTVRPLP